MSGPQGFAGNRPGADTRLWLTLAVVTDLGWDPKAVDGVSGGVFADVQFQPTGELETCYIGMPYAGPGYGAWYPLEVGDTVLVAVPNGDTGFGPVIIARLWNSGALPPSATDLDWAANVTKREPPTDVVIRVKPGASYKLRGTGASEINIALDITSTGDIVVENLGSGKVKLGLAETAQPVALSPLVEAAIKAAVEDAIAGHSHSVTVVSFGTPAGSLGGMAIAGLPPPAVQRVPYTATVDSTAATKTEAT